jgi:hypothetical protein
MSALSIQPTYPIFTETDGQPLEDGYIWIGQANLDPQVNPITVYWDAALTIPAVQPIRTNGGYPINSGTPARLYVNSDYSIRVMNKNGSVVYSAPTATERYSDVVVNGINAEDVVYDPPFANAVQTNVELKLSEAISVKDFGALGDGLTDDTQAIQDAIDASNGRPILVPAGTYRVTSTLTYQPTTYTPVFGAGLKLIGDGPFVTYFDNQANGPLISMTTASTISSFKGAVGAVLEGFTIKRTVSTTNGVGIYMTAAYNPLVRNINIDGMSLHGIHIPCVLGDNDGSNMVALDHVRIENCAGWGIKADGDSGFNETSFIYMQHTFIQACGTASGAYQPPSGGMIWKGQILTMQQCAFTLNENSALFIPSAAGLGQTVDLQSTTFENNKARSLFCRGISMFKARNIQFYNNNSYTSTVACEFEGASFVIRQVDINGVVVRATSGNNPYTAFKISGANTDFDSCRVRNVTWDNFDFAGQTRFDGWQFDPIPTDEYILQVPSSTEVYVRPNTYIGKGNKIPLRLQGPRNQGGVGVASTSGEWITHQLGSNGIFYNPATLPLAANTRYWLYLYDNNGLPALEASAAASQVTDPTSGYAVKSGDATRYYVGSIIGGGVNGTVATTGVGWLNPTVIANGASNGFAYMWVDSTGDVRIKSNGALPGSDTDGTVVGTQT